MAILGGIFGPDQGDYNKLGSQVYQPNASAYSNTADPGALGALGGVSQAQTNLGASGVGNQGLAAQQDALQTITNMANGNGPSLARANMQQGLAQSFGNLSNQAMSNQGNNGAGNSQRNLLNAQANASNAVTGQAGVASVAEQMGALQQQNAAAQGLTSGELSQGNFQAGLLQDRAGNAVNQAHIGQQDTQNAMALDASNKAAQDQKLNYQMQGMNANKDMFGNVLNDVGKVANIAGSVASTVATGGMSNLAQGLVGGVNGLSAGGNQGAMGNTVANAAYQDQINRANQGFNQTANNGWR